MSGQFRSKERDTIDQKRQLGSIKQQHTKEVSGGKTQGRSDRYTDSLGLRESRGVFDEVTRKRTGRKGRIPRSDGIVEQVRHPSPAEGNSRKRLNVTNVWQMKRTRCARERGGSF